MKNIRHFENFDVSLSVMDKVYERIEAKMDLPQDVINFQKLFDKAGYKLFVVGGAVRDYLMGKKPHDFDMVTDTTPEKVMEILKDYRTDLQGVHFGVVRVFTKDEPEGYEIASYRKDIAKGRDTKSVGDKVEIGDHITIKDDVRRRDLTMNALFYDIKTGEIVDVVGGVKDIKDKIVRAVGNPRKRFDEDRLRILRTLRFAAVTHSKLDPKTEKALRRDSRLFNISDVDDVSRERIFLEFKKVKEKARKNNDPVMMKTFVDYLIEFGIMEQIFPVITKHKFIRPTSYLTVAIAQVLRDNEITPEFKETLKEAKIPTDFVEIISILIDLYRDGVAPEDAYETFKTIRNKGLRKDILQEWINVMGITDKSVLAMLEYEPVTTGKELIAAGFKGAGIGNEMRKREAERFKEMLKESVITRDKKKEIFNYNSIIKDAWSPVISKAQKFQNISFDTENNDSTGQKKTIYISKNLRKDQPIKYEINAELWKAGGDWQRPIMYFKLEFTHDYGLVRNPGNREAEFVWDLKKDYNGLYKHYVLIPPVEAGNPLVQNDKGKWVPYSNSGEYTDDELEKAKITPEMEKEAWKWLEETIEKAVEDRHKMLDESHLKHIKLFEDFSIEDGRKRKIEIEQSILDKIYDIDREGKELFTYLHTTDEDTCKKILENGFEFYNIHKNADEMTNDIGNLAYKLSIRTKYGDYVIVIQTENQIVDAKDVTIKEPFYSEAAEEYIYTLSPKHVRGYFNRKTGDFVENPKFELS